MLHHVINPITAGITAGITFASGALAMINESTPITLGFFLAGVAAIVGAAIWLGKIAINLTVRLEQGNARMERLEERVSSLETTKPKIHLDP